MDERDRIAEEKVAELVEAADPGALVTKFVLMVEVVDTDNERVLWAFASEGAKAWDTLGLIEYARMVEFSAGVGE